MPKQILKVNLLVLWINNLILKVQLNLCVLSSSSTSPSHSFLNNSIQKPWVTEELAVAQSEALERYQGGKGKHAYVEGRGKGMERMEGNRPRWFVESQV